MKNERKEDIKKEVERRLDIWLKNSTFDEMTSDGSYLLFDMSIALLGCPSPEEWMCEDDFDTFIDMEEFHSPEYDEIMREIFNRELDKLN